VYCSSVAIYCVHYVIIMITVILYNNKYRFLDIIFTRIIIILFIIGRPELAGVYWGSLRRHRHSAINILDVLRTARCATRLALNYYYYCSRVSCAYNVTHTRISLLLLRTNVIISACKLYTMHRTDLPMFINGILCTIAIVIIIITILIILL